MNDSEFLLALARKFSRSTEFFPEESRLRNIAVRIEKLEAAVRDIAPVRCADCDGTGIALPATATRRAYSCESCYGHEDRAGDGYLPNQNVTLAEWMSRPEVRAALAAERGEEG